MAVDFFNRSFLVAYSVDIAIDTNDAKLVYEKAGKKCEMHDEISSSPQVALYG